MENPKNLRNGEKIHVFRAGSWGEHCAPPPAEATVRIYLGGEELAALMCTPEKLRPLAAGFLYSSGIIGSAGELAEIEVDEKGLKVTAVLKNGRAAPAPRRAIKTPGFGGGVIFSEEAPLAAQSGDFIAEPQKLISLMEEMKEKAVLYRQSGGIHASALSDGDVIISIAEDIGRHNTLDKVLGECLLRGRSVEGCLMLTTGRVSSEMILKSARLGIAAIASLSSPTSRAVELARKLGLAMAGYVTKEGFIAYSGARRLGLPI